MGYSKQIDFIKKSLNDYQMSENKIYSLYAAAKSNAANQTDQNIKELNQQYYKDKNQAYADSAFHQRNTDNQLSARGLGKSGEWVQARLNNNLNLSNRLGNLATQRNNQEAKYRLDLADSVDKLSMEEAEDLRELLDKKTQYNLDIAEMELRKETSDADREADIEIQRMKNENELTKLRETITLEREKLDAEKDMLNTELRAERERQIAELEAEADMLEAELEAKYGSGSGSGNGSGSGGGNTDSGDYYTPALNPQSLAQHLTGGKRISGEDSEYGVNKFLLTLNTDYNIDPEYYEQLLFMLETYGYKRMTLPEIRTKVITYEAKAYNSKEEYDRIYNSYIDEDYSPREAEVNTKKRIAENQMDYIYGHVKNDTEFRVCCIALGIGTAVYQAYLNTKNR